MNYNSTINQEIKGKFVGREVIQNVNELINHLLQTMHELPIHHNEYYDELTNLGYSYDFENTAFDEGWEYNEDEGVYFHPDNEETYEDAEELCNSENLDPQMLEPYEFWSVSEWLGEKLKQNGEIVENIYGLTIWGRCTTGQAILLDYAISKVCEDLEILEGQKSDWSKQ
jgi:hypothetical protein